MIGAWKSVFEILLRKMCKEEVYAVYGLLMDKILSMECLSSGDEELVSMEISLLN